jgi:hypothetical protein
MNSEETREYKQSLNMVQETREVIAALKIVIHLFCASLK